MGVGCCEEIKERKSFVVVLEIKSNISRQIYFAPNLLARLIGPHLKCEIVIG